MSLFLQNLLRSLKPKLQIPRYLSTQTPTTHKDKSRSILSQIRYETSPERIFQICQSASLNPESHLDRLAYSRAISKLKKLNTPQTIRSLIQHSLTHLPTQSERVLSHFIVLYGQAGLIEDAFNLFDEMPHLNIPRNIKTLNSLLYSCVLAERYDEMKRVFLEYPKKYGLEANLDTYNTVLKGFCESGSSGMAHSVLAEMERKGVRANATTFAIAIAGFYRDEMFSDVGKMMQLMKRYGMETGIGIYNVRIQSLCKLSRSAEAKALLDGILSRGMKANCVTYRHLIYGFCREGKLDVATKLFMEMVEKGLEPEAECYFTMVYYFCRGGEFEAALRICSMCMSKGWVPNISTMKSLVEGLINIGKVDEAKEVIRQVKEKFSRNADSWSEIEEKLPK